MMELLFIGAGSYLTGSLPVAVIVCHILHRSDPRKAGSGNPGATNVARLYGRGAGALVFALDSGKGALAVFAAMLVAERSGADALTQLWAVPLALIAVNSGHAKSVFMGFEGGKCVASGMGALAPVSLWLCASVAAIWLVVFALFRISALAAVSSFAMLVPVWLILTSLEDPGLPGLPLASNAPLAASLTALCALVLLRHRKNYAVIARELASRRRRGR